MLSSIRIGHYSDLAQTSVCSLCSSGHSWLSVLPSGHQQPSSRVCLCCRFANHGGTLVAVEQQPDGNSVVRGHFKAPPLFPKLSPPLRPCRTNKILNFLIMTAINRGLFTMLFAALNIILVSPNLRNCLSLRRILVVCHTAGHILFHAGAPPQ